VGSYIYLQPILAVVFGLIHAALSQVWGGYAVPEPPPIGWITGVSAAAIFLGVHLVSREDRLAPGP
jgi:hypothetical protein